MGQGAPPARARLGVSDLDFRGAIAGVSRQRSSSAEPLLKILTEPVEVDVFNGHLQGMIPVMSAAATSLAHPQPVGRPVANPGKTIAFDKSLCQAWRDGVSLPVTAQSAQDSAQNVAGQMRHAHMRQNEKAVIVNE